MHDRSMSGSRIDEGAIAASITALLDRRAPEASICPSEVARELFSPGWRDAMPRVREVAARMAGDGRIRATQGEVELRCDAITTARGPIRLRRGPRY